MRWPKQHTFQLKTTADQWDRYHFFKAEPHLVGFEKWQLRHPELQCSSFPPYAFADRTDLTLSDRRLFMSTSSWSWWNPYPPSSFHHEGDLKSKANALFPQHLTLIYLDLKDEISLWSRQLCKDPWWGGSQDIDSDSCRNSSGESLVLDFVVYPASMRKLGVAFTHFPQACCGGQFSEEEIGISNSLVYSKLWDTSWP